MLVMGIETSCDETAVAIVADDRRILSNRILSQLDEHRPYGGVVPEIAARSHLQHLPGITRSALDNAGVSFSDLDGVAATAGPGLIGGVMVGLMAAKSIALVHELPFIAINHMEAHALTPRLTDDIAFPYLALLVSGGHSQFVAVAGANQHTIYGATIDDAIGEAFDKAATILEAGYPGGPAIEALAVQGDPEAMKLPVARLGEILDFSFSGLKTALLYGVRGRPEGRGRNVTYPRSISDLQPSQRADAAASFQKAAVTAIVRNLRRALERHEVRSLLAGGGVTANTSLRLGLNEVAQAHSIELRLAEPAYCVDNAAMIAGLGDALHAAGIRHGMDLAAAARVVH